MSNIKRAIFIVIGIYGFCGGFGWMLVRTINRTLPSVRMLEDYTPRVTRVYDRKGELIHEFYEERRIVVPLERIPKLLIDATIMVEDKSFYRHCGVDLSGIMRATLANILNLRAIQGASTITQQLARNLFLTSHKSFLRKIKEALLATHIERVYSKDEILELYFNQIYYGNGYGVETASERYFGKHVEELTIPECAMLAGIPKSPVRYSPFSHPEVANKRKIFILNLMAENGIISVDELQEFKNTELILAKGSGFQELGAYFIEEVRKWVTSRFGPDLLYRGGISIYTTLDIELQQMAESSIEKGLPELESKYKIEEDTLQSALLAMNPKNGAILAEIGGRDFRESQFNRAVQARRQPGSAFKPFTWLAAFAAGSTAASIVNDDSISVELVTGDIYSPINYDHEFFGPVTLREGLAKSRNLVAVRLIMDVGPASVVGYARRMGITSSLDPVIALSLGSSSTTILDMVSAYATLASGGVRTTPYMIDKIIDKNGTLLYRHSDFRERVLSPELTYLVTSVMESVLNAGTGIRARMTGFTRSAAGKTGTTDDCADAWFIGFTPSLVCAVWIGFDRVQRIGRNATGAQVALPIWTDFMLQATEDEPFEKFKVPPGIVYREICKNCGKLASFLSKQVREEVFIRGTEPIDECTGHYLRTLRDKEEFRFP
ncbi:PBP1A family penicillin-binding protein [candidate division WOR-3 bacterium]|nr:PBP1A family penicillin-binding protein [candidate division WOR-3 bacterium]